MGDPNMGNQNMLNPVFLLLCPMLWTWNMGAPIMVLSMLFPTLGWGGGGTIGWLVLPTLRPIMVLSTLLPIMVSSHDGTI